MEFIRNGSVFTQEVSAYVEEEVVSLSLNNFI